MAEKINSVPYSPSEAMRLAIAEAKKGHGWVSPNPVVGCVILDGQGRLLSTGYHKKIGGPHAEVEALQSISEPARLKGAHLFVTLEPCAHFGRTPPCAEALAKLPLKEVTYGLLDPNPKVSGRGAERIRAAGIKCSSWSEFSREHSREIEAELNELCEAFLYNQRQQKTFVALKVATSLDGYLGLKSGESKWITGEPARQMGQELRAQYDAVLIGKNTFLEDDPSLNIRLPGFEKHQNKVVLIDPKGEGISKLVQSNLAKNRDLNKIFLATQVGDAIEGGPQIVKLKADSAGKIDLAQLLELLWQNEIKSVFVEGGAGTFSGFLEKKLFQRLHLFMAPNLIGGAHGRAWTESFGSERLAERLEFGEAKPLQVGRDLYLSLKPTKD